MVVTSKQDDSEKLELDLDTNEKDIMLHADYKSATKKRDEFPWRRSLRVRQSNPFCAATPCWPSRIPGCRQAHSSSCLVTLFPNTQTRNVFFELA